MRLGRIKLRKTLQKRQPERVKATGLFERETKLVNVPRPGESDPSDGLPTHSRTVVASVSLTPQPSPVPLDTASTAVWTLVRDKMAQHQFAQQQLAEQEHAKLGRAAAEHAEQGHAAEGHAEQGRAAEEHAELGRAAEKHPAEAHAEQQHGQGQIVVFFSSHGGTGATTLACNAAAVLARAGRSACVVDLDLQFGDVLVMFDLEAKCPMSQLARDVESFNWDMLGPMLARHDSGVGVVSQAGHVEDLDELSSGRIPPLLRCLQEHFQYVIVDGIRDFDEHALAAMDVANRIVVVATPDVLSVRGLTRRLQIFDRLGYPTDRIQLVINRADKRSPICARSMKEAAGTEPTCSVRNDYPVVHAAVNDGRPLAEAAPGAKVTADVEQMARTLFGLPAPAQRPGFFARLFKRAPRSESDGSR